jgi:hypothetical protein
MNMNDRKMNNYSVIRVGSVLVLAIALVLATFTFPLGTRTGANPISNSPPNEPSSPEPINGSTNVAVTENLSWIGGDPDGDPVTYDVFFGTTSPPGKVVTNQSTTLFDPIGTMNYSTPYYWRIIAWDNQSASTMGPQWEFTTESAPNNPPNTPSNPSPLNESTDILLTVDLGWVGSDSDNDSISYDVYFGANVTPPLVSTHQSNLSYDPGTLVYNTVYYWRIIAWDEHEASAIGPIWHFTTKQEGTISVVITKPLENKFYLNDQEKSISLPMNTIVYGPITISVNASADGGISKVECYIDGKLFKQALTAEPYEWLWQPLIQFNGLSLKHTIKIVAYDNNGNNASTELNVTKWRFHILPFVVAGVALASRFLLHTTVRGLVFNLKESRIAVSFYAIRTHYKTIGPFKSARGVINFKSCMGGILIGPIKLIRFGPFHKFAYGSFTFIGNVHYDTGGFGQGIIKQLLQPRTNSNLGGMIRNLKN